MNPFLRWTGSKRWFVKELFKKYEPNSFNNYHEPFLGAGSVFFNLKKKDSFKCYLSDTNQELINTYIQLRDFPNEVINYLKKFNNTETDYYKIRSLKPRSKTKSAARFIFLNKTSFNGIYRVNNKGIYNVPYGKNTKTDFINEAHLQLTSEALQGVNISCKDFYDTIDLIKENDLVFLDPPYTVAHENNGFIEYNKALFSWDDQIRLGKFIELIKEKKAHYILTNASHQSILDIYQRKSKIDKVSRYCQVGGRVKTRGSFNELIIYNTTK